MKPKQHEPESFHPRSARGGPSERRGSAFQVHGTLRALIRTGEIPAGTTLKEDFLISELGANRTSVRTALQLLVDEGLITRRRREGTIVVGSITQIPSNQVFLNDEAADEPILTMLGQHVVQGESYMSRRLHISGQPMRISELLISSGGSPSAVLTTFMADGHIADQVVWRINDMSVDFSNLFETPLAYITSTIEAVALEPRTSTLLGVPVGSPAILRELVLIDAQGTPRMIHSTLYRGATFAMTNTTSMEHYSSQVPFGDLL
jgi:GntR family transcriptional regulator